MAKQDKARGSQEPASVYEPTGSQTQSGQTSADYAAQQKADAPAGSAELYGGPGEPDAYDTATYGAKDFGVHLSFYDAATLKFLNPPQKLISFYRAGDKNSKIAFDVPDKKKNLYILHDITDPTLVEVILNEAFDRNCERFVSGVVAFMARPGSKEACMVHAPLFKLQGYCRIKFHAFDNSDPDDIDDRESQLDGVRLTLTPVRSPRGQNEPASSAMSRTYSAETVAGLAEINGVPRRQLFQLTVEGPRGFICRSVPEFVQTCCDSLIDIELPFESCDRLPAPTFVFVRDGCPATRCSGLMFEAAGSSYTADPNGIWTPEGLMGPVDFSHPNWSFFPSHVELDKNASPVVLVTVSESIQRLGSQLVQGRFVDDANLPFVHRPLAVLLPNGDEIEVVTDHEGGFVAPHGSKVFAREDEWGLATTPVLLTSTM